MTIFVFVAAISAALLAGAWSGDASASDGKSRLKRRLVQTATSQRRDKTDPFWGHYVDGGYDAAQAELDRSIVTPAPQAVSPLLSASSNPPPPSPGIAFARTSYDYQHNQTGPWQVGRLPGADIVHFTWMHWNKIPFSIENADRFVHYNSYTVSTNTFNQGSDGCGPPSELTARAGYTCLGIGSDNDAYQFEHQRPEVGLPYMSYVHWYPSPGSCLHIDNELASTPLFGEVMWPHGNVQRNFDTLQPDIVHVLSHGSNEDPQDRIVYWRSNGMTWEGPVAIDSNFTLGYIITADPNSDKAAIALHTNREPQFGELNNVAYYESVTEGVGWISGAELGDAHKVILTNYTSPTGPEAYVHIGATYDNSSRLHIVWDELRQHNQLNQVAIRHWNSERGTIRPVAFGYWGKPIGPSSFSQNLAKLTVGIGDGATPCQGGLTTNHDYVYVLYTRFAGPTAEEQDDHSFLGEYNGELYLNVSTDRGLTWSPPNNLTNTKTPGCNPGPGTPSNPDPPRPDSVCRSEHWASIGEMVHDIDIIFISDLDAGGIPQGEGTWQMNPVHYLRLPGGTTDAPHLCPTYQANFAASLSGRVDCEYHAIPGGSNTEDLTITNLGNAVMTGTISTTQFNGPPNWLTVAGPGSYSVNPGTPDEVRTVTMSAIGVANGTLLQGRIDITHNDTSQPSPAQIPINFFVFNEFYCPEAEFVATKTGSLALQVESNGRFGSQIAEGGLFRFADSSSGIFDASLLVAYGPQGPDTVVFHRFFDRADTGQFGFRAQSNLILDTSAYQQGSGYLVASALMSTKDSIVGVTVDWVFPQHPDSSEFILARWSFYAFNDDTITDLVVGLLIDFDIAPAARYGQIQTGVDNSPGGDYSANMIWQQGTDTTGHVITEDPPRTATRYRGGLVFISDQPFPGGRVGNNGDEIQPGGGPSSGFLYRSLVNISGLEQFTDSAADLYTIVDLARGRTLWPGDTITTVVALLSDTLSEASLKATAAKARAFAAAIGYLTDLCECNCHADPACDGIVDVLDVVIAVGTVFRNAPADSNQFCPFVWVDVNCDGVTDVVDVVALIAVASRGADPALVFCDPCG